MESFWDGFEKRAVTARDLLSIDLTKGMPEEERASMKSKVPWYRRELPGIVPMALIGGRGGHTIASLARGGKKARLVGGALGSATFGLSTAALANDLKAEHRGLRKYYKKKVSGK